MHILEDWVEFLDCVLVFAVNVSNITLFSISALWMYTITKLSTESKNKDDTKLCNHEKIFTIRHVIWLWWFKYLNSFLDIFS